MNYKITVVRVEPLNEGEKYNDTTTLYEQRFEAEDEREALNKIIDAVNK